MTYNDNMETIKVDGEVITAEERIAELEDKIKELQGYGGGARRSAITQFMQNPRGVASSLNLTEAQALNVRSLITGAGAAAAEKYLSRSIGAELAGALGGLAGAWIARKMIG